ncbi:MAG: putative sensor protein [Ilumatobacteraceae bacterium]|nr:putative sensor protein [Ilumatobacteraceae bacterium]
MPELNDPLAESIRTLTSFFVGSASMADTLTRVAELARDATPGVRYIGMTMMVNDKPATTVFTDPESPEIDQDQYRAGRGPCVESFLSGEIRIMRSSRRDRQWPEFADACLARGIITTLSLPLARGDERFGAMNMYADRAAAFDEPTIEGLRLFADQASIVLANAASYWDARTLSEQLAESIESRAIIEQAKGIIMASLRCSADVAFGHLLKQSQTTNTKLREVAQGIVKSVDRR